MLLILYSQPFRSLFCKVQDLDTQHFQLACPLSQCGDLMWYCNVGEVHIDDLYYLVIVIADALKLEIKVVKSGDELRLRRVASDNDGLFAEDFFNNKTTSVMLQSGFAEQLAKADVLLFIKPERVFITRRSGLLIGLVCRFSVHIHIWLKKDRSRVATRASQSEDLFRTNPNLSDKGTARCFLAKTKIRGGGFLSKVSEVLQLFIETLGFEAFFCRQFYLLWHPRE